MEEFIEIEVGKDTLYGVYHQGERSKAGLIFIHGIPGDRVDTRRLPVRLSRYFQKELGISSIRTDFYGSGITNGEFYNVTYTFQKRQAECIIDYVKQQQLWSGPTILIAFSEAAKIALSIAKDDPSIRGICVLNGLITFESWQSEQKIHRLYRREGEMVFDIGYGVWLNKKILEEAREYGVESVEDLPEIPILGIYGGADMITTESRKFLCGSNQTLKIIADADHLFTDYNWELQIFAELQEWLTQNFHCGGERMNQ